MNRILPLFAVLALAIGEARAADWLHWRGPEQNGVSRETDLPEKWSPDPKAPDNNLVWKAPYGCRSSPLVMNGRVFIINDCDRGINEQERVMCFDAATGKVLWEHRFNIFFTDIVSSRVGWTNLAGDAETGNVYAHGIQGLFFCFNRDGKILWQHSLTEEYGRVTGYGGRVTTPIVDGDLVILGIINASWGDQARGANRFVAFDKRTGIPVWWSDVPNVMKGTYYSVPVVAIINGQRLFITGGSDGYLHAFKVRTGEHVWSYPVSLPALNSSPVVAGSLVYITNDEENIGNPILGCVVCVDAGQIKDKQPKLVWRVDGVKAGYTSPIVHEGRLYVCDDTAKMFCYDAATGKQLWTYKYGRLSRGSPVWADGKIYVAEVNSKFHILKPDTNRCKELHEQFFPSPDGKSFIETNGTPAVADGRVYFANRDNVFCIAKKDRKASPATVPPLPPEAKADPKAKATHLQVVPADIVLSAGGSAVFKAHLYDADGRFLRETPAKWTTPVPPPAPGSTTSPPALRGELADGKLTLIKEVPFQQGYVKAEAEGLSNQARVRVVPSLPIKPNLEKVPEGRPPSGWVNTAGKYTVVKMKDGTSALKKMATDARPPLARANAYIGMPNLADYTIQTDLMGTKVRNNMPDIGVINNRYTLFLDGNKQQLRIISWEALPRIDKTIPWEWKPDTWYQTKLVVDLQGDKGTVRGKVWPRGQPEPTAWSIEVLDPKPNREGSPALYGYATGVLEDAPGAEGFYQNVSVTPNKK